MRLFGKILLGLGGLVAVLLVIGWAGLFHTGAGKSFIESRLQQQLENIGRSQLASEVTIGGIGGNLPGYAVLRDVTLTGDEGVWFRVEELRLRWSPLGLINRRILIRELSIMEAELLARPPARPARETSPKTEPRPFNLPWIELDKVTLDSLTVSESILGTRREFLADGQFSTAGGLIRSDFEMRTRDQSDTVRALIRRAGSDFGVDIDVSSAENGVVAGLLEAGGPLSLQIAGNAPLEDWSGTLNLAGGQFGLLNAEIAGNLKQQNRFVLSGTATPGPKWPATASEAAGEQLVFDLAAEKARNRWTILVNNAEGAFGSLEGRLPGIKSASDIRAEDLALTLTLAPAYAEASNLPFLTGKQALTGDFSRDQSTIGANLTLVNMMGVLSVTDLSLTDTDGLNTGLKADLTPVKLPSAQLTALLENGLQAETNLAYRNSLITLGGLKARTPRGDLTVAAEASYNTETASLAANGAASIPPRIIGLFTNTVTFQQAASVDFAINGTPDNLSPDLTIRYSRGELAGQQFTSGRLTAKISDLQTAPEATLALDAADRSYSARARVSQGRNNLTRADITSLRTGHMTTAGTVTYGGQRVTTDLTLRADEAAAPPDAPVSRGTLKLAGTATLGETPVLNLTLTGNEVISPSVAAEEITLSASGPLSQLALSLDGSNMLLGSNQRAAELTTRAVLELTENQTALTINEASAKARTTDKRALFRLMAPARITRTNGTTILDRTRIIFRDDAGLELEGGFSPRRWTLDATGSKLRLPYFRAPLDLEINLDTDNDTPARINLAGQVTNQDDNTYVLRSATIWDGRELGTISRIASDGQPESGTFTLTLPLVLTRGDTLSVSTGDQSLRGQFRFQDRIEAILAFIETGGTAIEGLLGASVEISGTLEEPSLAGDMTISDGRYEEEQTGAVITDIAAKFEFALGGGNTDGQFTLTGTDAAGQANRIRLAGEIELGQQADQAVSRISGSLKLDRATLVKSPDLTLQANSDLSLSGSLTEMLLEGSIDVLRLDAVIPEIKSRKTYVPVEVVRVDQDESFSVELEEEEETTPVTINLDLAIRADNEILISGRGLTSEWKASLDASGTAASPVLTGSIESLRGSFDFAGRQFDLERGIIRFPGGTSLIPRLDIRADYEADLDGQNITSQIGVEGPATDPEITISSIPVLPQEDVLALVLFGKEPTELSAFESLRIASAVASLSGTSPLGSGAGLGDSLRRTLGLDALSFAQDAASGLSNLTVGKYISDDIYISTTQAVGGIGTSVSITYDVTDSVSLESTVEQDGAQSVSANYKRDY